MPDPLLYLQAFSLAALTSALVMWGLLRLLGTAEPWRLSAASVMAIAAAHVAGCWWLRLPIAWPAVSALDRYLLVLLPAICVIEMVAALPRVSDWGANSARLVLALVAGRVLLHRSVYLNDYSAFQAFVVIVGCGMLAGLFWWALSRLQDHSPGISVPLALAMTIQAAGIAIMMGGYLRGGLAAMVAAAALVGASLASARLAKGKPFRMLLGFGVLSLCSLLFIGVFFGRLSIANAVVLWGAPLLCWATELPRGGVVSPGKSAALRLGLVAVALVIVLLIARQKFEREFRPLMLRSAATLGSAQSAFGAKLAGRVALTPRQQPREL